MAVKPTDTPETAPLSAFAAIGLTADDARAIRGLLGISLNQIRAAAALTASDPLYRNNLLLAIGAAEAASLAIHVRGDRARWNFDRAHGFVERWRATIPEIAHFRALNAPQI